MPKYTYRPGELERIKWVGMEGVEDEAVKDPEKARQALLKMFEKGERRARDRELRKEYSPHHHGGEDGEV